MSWTPGGKPQDLLARAKTMGDLRHLRVCDWTSQLILPLDCWNDGPSTCQCGAYRLERRAARYSKWTNLCPRTEFRPTFPIFHHHNFYLQLYQIYS